MFSESAKRVAGMRTVSDNPGQEFGVEMETELHWLKQDNDMKDERSRVESVFFILVDLQDLTTEYKAT